MNEEIFLTDLERDTQRLVKEAHYVYKRIIPDHLSKTEYDGFPEIMHGFMMGALSRIDCASKIWFGKKYPNQTRRMVEFLDNFKLCGREEAQVLIEIWRHALMHTGSLRQISIGSQIYTWNFHWGEGVGSSRHLTLQNFQDGRKCLNIGLIYFIDQITYIINNFIKKVRSDNKTLYPQLTHYLKEQHNFIKKIYF
jgi:hypothetical protein